MKVAYLVNQYPKVSHAFIRREIRAVEMAGVAVSRYSLRRAGEQLLDSADCAEAERTQVLQETGALTLVRAVLVVALGAPLRFVRGLRLALALGGRSPRGRFHHLAYLAEACLLLRGLRREKIGHVHTHFGTNSATVALLCCALGDVRFSFTAHGPEEFDLAWPWSLRNKIESAAFVVAVSNFGRSQLYRQCGHQHWPRIHVVPCGVDQQFLEGEPSAIREPRRLLCIGRLAEQKGQLLLIEALARLQRAGRDPHLTLIGEGELRAELEQAIAAHGLQGNVEMVGSADGRTIRRALDDACALVLPSFAEGLPVVIMEAMARGRPVLSTYVAGIPELVQPGQNGWLVPAGSVEALATAMQAILDAPVEQLAELGRRGRALVAEQHDIGRIGERLAGLLREAAGPQAKQ
jgi:colanic acid/amylovoran biosynthesis glycosyltransferase